MTVDLCHDLDLKHGFECRLFGQHSYIYFLYHICLVLMELTSSILSLQARAHVDTHLLLGTCIFMHQLGRVKLNACLDLAEKNRICQGLYFIHGTIGALSNLT